MEYCGSNLNYHSLKAVLLENLCSVVNAFNILYPFIMISFMHICSTFIKVSAENFPMLNYRKWSSRFPDANHILELGMSRGHSSGLKQDWLGCFPSWELNHRVSQTFLQFLIQAFKLGEREKWIWNSFQIWGC